MVRSGVGGGCFWLGGGGWGTNASKPLGVNGVITMKMISSTSSTSISGVTFMFAFWPPLEPIAIAMIDLLYCYCVTIARPRVPVEWRLAAVQGFQPSADPLKGRADPRRRREHYPTLRLPSLTSPACQP